jgi:hypothetical protein
MKIIFQFLHVYRYLPEDTLRTSELIRIDIVNNRCINISKRT